MDKHFDQELHRQMKAYGAGAETERGLQRTLAASRAAFAGKRQMPQITFRKFLAGQLRFMGIKLWIFQALMSILLALPMGLRLENGYLEAGSREAAYVLGIAAIVSAMSGIPYVCRSLRYGMCELESATKFSHSGLLSARFMIVGLGNVVMLLAIWAAVTLGEAMGAMQAVIYLLLPFTAAWFGSMAIMRHICSQYTHIYCFGFSLLLIALLSLLYKSVPLIFSQEMEMAWVLVCVVIIAGLAFQAKKLIQKTSYMDEVSFSGV